MKDTCNNTCKCLIQCQAHSSHPADTVEAHRWDFLEISLKGGWSQLYVPFALVPFLFLPGRGTLWPLKKDGWANIRRDIGLSWHYRAATLSLGCLPLGFWRDRKENLLPRPSHCYLCSVMCSQTHSLTDIHLFLAGRLTFSELFIYKSSI